MVQNPLFLKFTYFLQVQYFFATLRGKVTLPTSVEMLTIAQNTNQELKKHGVTEKHYHTLATTQFKYLDDLAREAGLEQPPTFMFHLLNIVLLRLFLSYPVFKSYSYDLSVDGAIVEGFRGQHIATRWDLSRLVLTQAVRCLWRDFPRVVWFLGSVLLNKMSTYFRVSK